MTVAARLLRDRRRSLAYWTAGMAGLIFVSAVFYPSIKGQTSIDDLLRDLPRSLRAFVGAQAGISLTSPTGYLHTRVFSTTLPIVLLIFAVGLGARTIGGSEDDGTLELLLSNPITRARVALERYAAMTGLVVGLGAVATAALLALSPPFGLLEGVAMARLVAAGAAATSLAVLHASVAFAVGCAFGGRSRALGAAATAAVSGYVIFGLVSAGVVEFLRFVSPWWWYMSRNILVGGLPVEALAVPLGLSAILAASGVWAFGRRDLR